MSPAKEYEVIEDFIRGDAIAFAEIYNLYKDKVFAFAYSLTKSRETAEEVVQEVFIRLWEKKDQIRLQSAFMPYVKAITYNYVMDFFRRAKHDQRLQQQIMNRVEEIQASGDELVLNRELEVIYRQAIEALPPQQQRAYLLSREEHLSYEEIAAILGISRNTVRNHLSDALKNIRRHVSGNTDLAIIFLAICLSKSR